MAGDNAELIEFYEELLPLAREYDEAKAHRKDSPEAAERWQKAKQSYAAFRTNMRALAGRPADGTVVAGSAEAGVGATGAKGKEG